MQQLDWVAAAGTRPRRAGRGNAPRRGGHRPSQGCRERWQEEPRRNLTVGLDVVSIQ